MLGSPNYKLLQKVEEAINQRNRINTKNMDMDKVVYNLDIDEVALYSCSNFSKREDNTSSKYKQILHPNYVTIAL